MAPFRLRGQLIDYVAFKTHVPFRWPLNTWTHSERRKEKKNTQVGCSFEWIRIWNNVDGTRLIIHEKRNWFCRRSNDMDFHTSRRRTRHWEPLRAVHRRQHVDSHFCRQRMTAAQRQSAHSGVLSWQRRPMFLSLTAAWRPARSRPPFRQTWPNGAEKEFQPPQRWWYNMQILKYNTCN